MVPFLSVIIPVYNSEEYLETCFNSIIDQSYDSFEVILVDDGSSDGSLDIMRSYEEKYAFIKVLTQVNSGQGSARNKAIDHAKGKYIWFVDSDDWIVENAFETIKENLVSEPDILIFQYKLGIQENGAEVKFEVQKGFEDGFKFREYSATEIFKMFLNGEVQPLCSNKVYSKKLFTNGDCRFESGIYFEDFVHNALTLSMSSKTKVLNKDLYVYAQRNESTMTSKCSEKHVYSIFYALDSIKGILENQKIYLELEYLYIRLFWFHLTFVFFQFVSNGKTNHHELFLSKLKKITSQIGSEYFLPVKFDHMEKEVLPYATLLSLMLDSNKLRASNGEFNHITEAFKLNF